MDCVFCDASVQFSQHKMAHRIFELSDPQNKWWLCRECAEIRTRGSKTKGASGSRATCIDCDTDVTHGVTIMKKTPSGDVRSGETVFQVLCETHFDERRS